MIYTPENAAGAVVYDMVTAQKISRVVSIDTEKREVTCHVYPIRVVNGEPATQTRTFGRIELSFDESNGRLFSAYCFDEVRPTKPSA